MFQVRCHVNDYLINSSGLLIGRGKKDKFREIYRDKFTEKMADFITHTHTHPPPYIQKGNTVCLILIVLKNVIQLCNSFGLSYLPRNKGILKFAICLTTRFFLTEIDNHLLFQQQCTQEMRQWQNFLHCGQCPVFCNINPRMHGSFGTLFTCGSDEISR